MNHRNHERLSRIVSDRAGHRGFSGWVGLVCETAVEQVNADGTAIAVRFTGRAQELVAVTGAWAQQLEELQYTVGEGPAVEARDTGEPVLVPDFASSECRWPGFAEAASGTGMGSVFAFPLRSASTRLGSLSFYRRHPGALPPDELSDAVVLTDLATVALLFDTGLRSEAVAGWVQADAPGHYDDVNVATGMLAAALRVSVEDAFLRLRAYAFSHNEPLLAVARAVSTRRLRTDSFRD